MKKFYILDTNVLLHDPNIIYGFADNTVIIPIIVIEELDKFKKDLSEIGRNAREVSRQLDKLRLIGKLSQGVPLDNGGKLKVELEGRGISRVPDILKKESPDNRILTIGLALKERYEDTPVILISKDMNARIKADAIGLIAQDFEASRVEIEELYTGFKHIDVDSGVIDQAHADGFVHLDDVKPYPNEAALLRDRDQENHTAITRYNGKEDRYLLVKTKREPIWGITPRNVEQTLALDLLLDEHLSMVTLAGKAGTGKTLLAIAAGLYATLELGIYTRVLISRPIFPLGRDLGYLPGDVEEKLRPWMQPIFDNLELLLSNPKDGKKVPGPRAGRKYEELMEMGVVEIEPLTYIRGRSIANQYMIIDEAQNLTPHEVKTILTRAGHNTKIVFTGDPYQIDNPYVDSASNGLCYLVEKFKGEDIAGHMTLRKGERSFLAERAATLL